MKSEFINCTSSSYKSCSEGKHQNGADGCHHSFLVKVSVLVKVSSNNIRKMRMTIAIPGFSFLTHLHASMNNEHMVEKLWCDYSIKSICGAAEAL